MGLAALLIPLIPSAVNSIIGIVDAIREHPDTPEDLKAHLADISVRLTEVAARVEAVQLPD